MKPLYLFLTGFLALCLNFASYAQHEFTVPEYKLEANEDYAKFEQDIIKAANWLETTAVSKDMAKRKNVNVFVATWLAGSPNVRITFHPLVAKLSKKNHQLLGMFMAGYARYALENNYEKDEVKLYAAGIRSVINLYNLGGDVKSNTTLQQAIGAEKAGILENWVRLNYKAE
jgi:hypothetical protein